MYVLLATTRYNMKAHDCALVTFQSETFRVYKIHVSLLVQIWYNCHHRNLEVMAHFFK